MKAKKILKHIGRLLLIISVVYMAKNILTYRAALSAAFTTSIIVYTVVCSIISGAFVLVSGLLYHGLACRLAKKNFQPFLLLSIYSKSNLYKYLPGNVAHYLGRQAIADNDKSAHGSIAFSSVLEAGISVLASLIASLTLAFGFVVDWVAQLNLRFLLFAVAFGFLAVCLAGLLLRQKLKRTFNAVKHFFAVRNIRWLLLMLIYNILNQLAIGLLFSYLLKIMSPSLPSNYLYQIAGVYSFAWLAGFITPGVPGGIGIRETMLTVLLNTLIDPEIIVAAVLINRIVTVLGDALACPAAWLLQRLFGKESKEAT